MTTTKTIDEEIDLGDSPVLSSEPLWPESLTESARPEPPPPPPARRARGTAPLGEPITSGLIDIREMAAAYAVAAPSAEESLPDLASGTSPIELVALESELAPLLEPDTSSELPPLAPRRQRAIAVVAIGAALVAAAVLAGSLLLGNDEERAPSPAQPPLREAPPLIIRADEVPVPEVRVIPLPTTVTEVAPRPRARRPAARRPLPRAR
jgi:hypothetical protein